MKNKMILKVYDVDYSFIIKNYLNKELWNREWTLFYYKNFVITLRLRTINIIENKIVFEIKAIDNNIPSWNRSTTQTAEYSFNVDNVDILKKMINTRMLWALQTIEKELYIKRTDDYYKLCEMEDEERKKLEKIAEDFLDENDISNDNIRVAYIEAFIDNTEKTYDLKKEYEYKNEYKMLPDLFLIFAKATKNEEIEKCVLNKNFENQQQLLTKINELEKYLDTEEYEEEVKSNLDEIYN